MANSAIPKNKAALDAEYILATQNADLPNAIELDILPPGTVSGTTIIMGQLDGLGGNIEGYTAQDIANLSGAGSNANQALSNLASVAINTPLLGDTDNTHDFGSDAFRWKNIYATGMYSALSASDVLNLGAYDVDGATFQNFIVFTSGNTPTCAINAATISGGTMSATTMNANTATNFTHQTGSIGTAVTGVTQAPGDNSTKLATTEYVDATGSGTVTSVTGTASRITSTGGATPVIDISASYVGQASITTLGTITTGVWNGTAIAVANGGTGSSTAAGARTNLGVAIGSDVQAYDATLSAFAAYNTNGILTQTAADTFVGRTLTGTANELTVANGNGVSGNPTFSLPAALTFTGKTVTGGTIAGMTGTTFTHQTGSIGTAVTGVTQAPGDNSTKLATTEYVDATGSGTVTSVSGTTNRISSTGGATPIIDIDASYVGQASITTLGTITTGVWNGTAIAVANGGTGATTASNARTNLGVAIGSDVQAYDAALQSISGLTTVANNLIYTTASDTYAVITPANSSLLVTSGAGVPSLSTSIPDGVTATKQTVGDDSTKVATTSYVNEVVKTGQTDVACSSNITFTQDIDTNHYFKLTFTSNCTLAFTFTTGLVQSMCVELIDAGAYTVTLPAGLEWAGGTAPTFTSSGRDIIVVWNNGDNLVSAALIGQDFS